MAGPLELGHAGSATMRTAKHAVLAANPPAVGYPARWPLGPLDYYVGLGIPIQVVFIYEQPAHTAQEIVPVDRLRAAMSALLEHHPHFTGRLRVDAQDKQPHIASLGSGAELIEAKNDRPLASFRAASGDYVMTAFPSDLMSPYEPTEQYLAGHPFFAIQHTRFACGGVALAVRMAHAVVDGVGFFNVVKDLTSLYNTFDPASLSPPRLSLTPSIVPYMADWAAKASPDEVRNACSVQPPQYQLIDDNFKSGSNGVTVTTDRPETQTEAEPLTSTGSADPVIGRVLRFSDEQQGRLKALATDPEASPSDYVTTFDAMVTHVLQETYRARLSPSRKPACAPDKCNFLTPSDWRQALQLPQHHTPNTCFVNFCDLEPGKVVGGPTHQVAKAIHAVSRNLSLQDAQDQLRWLCAQPDKSRAQLAFSYGDGSLLLSSWLKMDLYGVLALEHRTDAAGTVVGKTEGLQPSFSFTPFTDISLIDGLGYFLPTRPPATSGSIERPPVDLALALKSSVWQELDRSPSRSFSYVG